MEEKYLVGDLVYFKKDKNKKVYEVIGSYETEKYEYGDYVYKINYDLLSKDEQETLTNISHDRVELCDTDEYFKVFDELFENLGINMIDTGSTKRGQTILDKESFIKNYEEKWDNSSLENKYGITSAESNGKLIYSKHLDVTLTEDDTMDNLLDDYNIISSKMKLVGYSPKDLEIFETQLEIIKDKLSLLSGKDGFDN